MKNRELVFVIITVLVLSCLTVAGPARPGKRGDFYDRYETLSHIVSHVADKYVEDVDAEKLFYGAYKGMLQTLDPHSAFLPPARKKDLEVETKGEFGGLGIEITLDKLGVLTVVAPLEGSPAFRAGVLAGDRIIKIEGKSTKGISLREAVNKLRGPKGKPVTITVLHESGKSEDIEVTRDIIKLESVKDPRFVDDKAKIAYIRLSQFQKNSAESLDKAVKELSDKGMKALVLDLRFNPGGLLASAIEVADRFLADGVIVSTKGRKSPERIFKAKADGTYAKLPLAVLISGRSASASEIVAGAIQDHRRGVLVGTRTYGKASVQTLIKLEGGRSAIRLTTAYYYTPSGRLIHRNVNKPDQEEWGIAPDIKVDVSLHEEVDLWNHWREEHRRKAREQNGEPEPKPKKKPIELDKDKKPEEPKEFHDKTLEAAVNALKVLLIDWERGR